MKDWFKYEFGFVNIDSKNIYLTNSGNWSEAKELEEKGVQKSNRFRKRRVQIFLIASFLLFAFLYGTNLLSGRISFSLIIGLPVLVYFLYHYLSPELGSKFKLPISKISKIEIEKTNITIEFIDSNNETNTEFLKNVEEKGLQIVENIKGNLSTNN